MNFNNKGMIKNNSKYIPYAPNISRTYRQTDNYVDKNAINVDKKAINKAINYSKRNKILPKVNKNVRPTSVELSRNKNNSAKDDNKIKLKNETKNTVNLKRKKIQDLNSVKGEIIGQVNKVGNGVNKVQQEITKVNGTLNGLKDEVANMKNILFYGFETLIALMKKDEKQYEIKNKEFHKSMEMSNKKKEEEFQIIENTEIKSNITENVNSNGEASEKISETSNKNYKDSLELNNSKMAHSGQNKNFSLSSSNSNKIEKVISFGFTSVITSNNEYSHNDTILLKNQRASVNGQNK